MNKRDRHAALTPERLSTLCYQLWMMQQAGVPLEQGVIELRDDASAPWSRDVLTTLHAALQEDLPLSIALSQSGDFPDYLLHMVHIGEVSGNLECVLLQLSEYYRREAELRESIQKAVTYPAFMTILIAAVFFILITQVLPIFLQVFDQLGLSLSPATAALVRFGTTGKYITGAVTAFMALTAAAALFLFHTKKGRTILVRHISIVKNGAAARAVCRSRFSSAMALMLNAGLPFDEAFDRAAALLENTVLSPQIEACREKISSGISLQQALREAQIFDSLHTGLLTAGFHAGVPAKAMDELARRYKEDADQRLTSSLERFEYGLVIALCAIVGLILLSVMLPLLGVLSSIGT